jgi:metallo-beta-lactamase family protein
MTQAISIQFLGASGTVTGSKFLLKTPDYTLLVDCGLFQGLKSLRAMNWDPFPFDVHRIQAVILTHAHLDHCGYLPLLTKQGFKGVIYCTKPTRDLTEVILMDSAKIQQEDAEYANRKGFTRHAPAVPLYTEDDVRKTMPLFRIVDKGERVVLSNNVQFTFMPNGHILGSAFIEMDCYNKRLLFSGDLGRPLSTLLAAPIPPPSNCDYVIMESTYGDRVHSTSNAADDLEDVILKTIQKKGNLLIPSFAVGRAQELIHIIDGLKASNRIPHLPVYLDSPMGANATDIFRKYVGWHKLSAAQCDAFVRNVTVVRDFKHTLEIADAPGMKIIIAASGMLSGGRALVYLKKYLDDARNSILFTGYQSEGTRGRALLRDTHELKIHGRFFPVKMETFSLGSLSGHADQNEMIDWLSKVSKPPEKIFLVHGENIAREAFSIKITDTLKWRVDLPQHLQEITLFNV